MGLADGEGREHLQRRMRHQTFKKSVAELHDELPGLPNKKRHALVVARVVGISSAMIQGDQEL
eukprot:3431252-Prorocentrum_lima.AAC.1